MFKTTATCPRNYDYTDKNNPCDCNCKNPEGLTPNICAAECEKYKARINEKLQTCEGSKECKRYKEIYIPILSSF